MINTLKKTIVNILVTTSVVIMVLPVIWYILDVFGADIMFGTTLIDGDNPVLILKNAKDIPFMTLFLRGENAFIINITNMYEIFFMNTIIYFGHLFTRKFESSYVILEYLLDLTYVVIVVIVFGVLFKWIYITPIWVLAVMGIVIYSFLVLLGITRIKRDAKELNKLLQERKEKNVDIVT
jgi:hypothetical protein